jgi:hypothetical protein
MKSRESARVYLLLERAEVGLREAALQIRVGHHHQRAEPHQIKSKPLRVFPSGDSLIGSRR